VRCRQVQLGQSRLQSSRGPSQFPASDESSDEDGNADISFGTDDEDTPYPGDVRAGGDSLNVLSIRTVPEYHRGEALEEWSRLVIDGDNVELLDLEFHARGSGEMLEEGLEQIRKLVMSCGHALTYDSDKVANVGLFVVIDRQSLDLEVDQKGHRIFMTMCNETHAFDEAGSQKG